MFCRHCGKQIADGSKFCPECGKALDNTPQIALQKENKAGSKGKAAQSKNMTMTVMICAMAVILVILIGMIVGLMTVNHGNEKDNPQSTLTPTPTAIQKEDQKTEKEEKELETPKEEEKKAVQEDKEETQSIPQNETAFKSSCINVFYEDFARNPSIYQGKPVKFYGEVAESRESGNEVILQVNVNPNEYGYFTDSIYVTYTKRSKNESRILEGDYISLWGKSEGVQNYRGSYGNTMTIPKVEAYYIEMGDWVSDGDLNIGYGEYILPDSSAYCLTDEDLRYLSKEELRLARNEIYARHGRMFNDKDLQAYFDQKSWYVPTIKSSDFKESMLSECEQYNVKFIKKLEDQIK